MKTIDDIAKQELDRLLKQIGNSFGADPLAIYSPIMPGLEQSLKAAVEAIPRRKTSVVVVLDTLGGIVEVVERMVVILRHHYKEVTFLIPDKAMSAGTVFAMAGDHIYMSYFSCLGPIDPQLQKDGRLVPALSYLNEFDRLNAKAAQGTLTSAEYALLSKLDLAELDQFRQAKELSEELLEKWLSTFKFKDWNTTEGTKKVVDDNLRRQRAKEVAKKLADNQRWHSHGRGIDMRYLVQEIGLKIEDIESKSNLHKQTAMYQNVLRSFMERQKLNSFVHSLNFF
jgi:hypothetical protein